MQVDIWFVLVVMVNFALDKVINSYHVNRCILNISNGYWWITRPWFAISKCAQEIYDTLANLIIMSQGFAGFQRP